MQHVDVLVIGAGISGLSFAWKAASAGHTVHVLESSDRVGGCLHSVRDDAGHWYELGGHTVYNSYGGFYAIAEGTGVDAQRIERGEARKSFGLLRNGEVTWLTPPKVLLQLNWLEVLWHGPFGIFASKTGQSMAGYYAKLIGPGNVARILSPFLAAVPSQSADEFPVEGPGSLFKKRPRREDVPRSFGFDGGLQAVCDGVAALDGVTIHTGISASRLSEHEGRIRVHSRDEIWEAERVAIATPPPVAARLVQDTHPALAEALGRVTTVEVDSMGVRLPRERCWMPECAFVVPVDDTFFSAVTRDPFPHPTHRSFAFHFRPGQTREARIARIAEVLRIAPGEFQNVSEAHRVLPAPRVGHDALVAEIDAELSSPNLALLGNYFDGLAIEDCVQRSFAEWARVAP